MALTATDPSARRLPIWGKEHKNLPDNFIRSENGAYVASEVASLTVGKYGPVLLADYNLIESLGHFNRERLPERVIYALGAGAHGYFKCYADLSDITASSIFRKNKTTNITVRFSLMGQSPDASDETRDIRGFAIKFFTEQGIWDLVGQSTPIFFIRDPALLPMLVHALKHNPATGTVDPNMVWDFFTLRPETLHQAMMLFSDRGIPKGYRHMNGYGVNTYSFINDDGKITWVKFHYLTNQNVKNFTQEESFNRDDPYYAVRDLYDHIAEGKFPSWTFYIQTMTEEKAKELVNRKDNQFNPFDPTKVWPKGQFPFRKIGEFTLNKFPQNYFTEVEQLAFNVNNLPPGIGPSYDRLLQGRLFAYQDAARYRLGANYEQLEKINKPYEEVRNYERDARHADFNQMGAPNYYPNSFGGPKISREAFKNILPSIEKSDSNDWANYYDLSDEDNYSQPNYLWNYVFDDKVRDTLVENLAESIKPTTKEIQQRAIEEFTKIDEKLGSRLNAKLNTLRVKL